MTERLHFHFSGHCESFPHSSVGTESACNAGDPGLIPVLGRSAAEGIGLPTPVFWPGDHGVSKRRTRLHDFHFHDIVKCWYILIYYKSLTIPSTKFLIHSREVML